MSKYTRSIAKPVEVEVPCTIVYQDIRLLTCYFFARFENVLDKIMFKHITFVSCYKEKLNRKLAEPDYMQGPNPLV